MTKAARIKRLKLSTDPAWDGVLHSKIAKRAIRDYYHAVNEVAKENFTHSNIVDSSMRIVMRQIGIKIK